MDVLVQLIEKVTVNPTWMHGLSDQESGPVAVGSKPGAQLSVLPTPRVCLSERSSAMPDSRAPIWCTLVSWSPRSLDFICSFR